MVFFMLMTQENHWIKVRFRFELPAPSLFFVTSIGCATVWCGLCGRSSREPDSVTVFGIVFLFSVLGWSKGTTFVFDDDQRRILCSYSVEVRVARALTEIGEREVG